VLSVPVVVLTMTTTMAAITAITSTATPIAKALRRQ
jgi:hypothetical protein